MRLLLLVAVLAPFVELAATVTADPVVSPNSLVAFPIKKHVHPTHRGSSKPAQRDLIRLRNLVERVQRRDTSSLKGIANVPLTVTNSFGSYSATIGVGCPASFYELIIDTASAITWVGANKNYKKTDTSVKTSDAMNITYGSGFMIGMEYIDSVTIAPGMVISGQSIGVASNTSGLHSLDGILGLGPPALTLHKANNTKVIPTVTDNLFDQGQIQQKLVAVSFEPATSASVTNGELTFGSTDSTKFIGDINYVPITDTYPSSNFWGIDASLQYGDCSATTILSTTAGVIDTGSALLGLAPDAYNLYLHATGGVYDDSTGFIRITPAQYNNLESLFFKIGGTRYELIPNAQIWPRALNTNIGGTDDFVYLVVSNLRTPPPGIDFIMGMVVLERLYTVFDSANHRVGFATTRFTNATTN